MRRQAFGHHTGLSFPGQHFAPLLVMRLTHEDVVEPNRTVHDEGHGIVSKVEAYARAALRISCVAVVGVRARASVEAKVRKRALFYITREASEVLVDVCETFMMHLGGVARRLAEHAGRSQVHLADVMEVLDIWFARTGGDGLTMFDLMRYASVEELAPPRSLSEFPRRRNRGRPRPTLTAVNDEEHDDEDADEDDFGVHDRLVWDARLLAETKGSDEREASSLSDFKMILDEADVQTALDSQQREQGTGLNAKTEEITPGHGAHIESWMPSFPPVHTFIETPVYASDEGQSEIETLRKLNEQRLQVEDALARARGTGFRALDNPYLQLPSVIKSEGSSRARDEATTKTLQEEKQVPGKRSRRATRRREALEPDMVSIQPGILNQEIAEKAERILGESGGAS